MPYIKQEDRVRFYDTFRELLRAGKINSPGELNYIFTVIINYYISDNGLNYQAINDVVGALNNAESEFYRTTVAPYEDIKIKENGKV